MSIETNEAQHNLNDIDIDNGCFGLDVISFVKNNLCKILSIKQQL